MSIPSETDPVLDQIQRTAGDASRKILLHGGTVLTMDASLGDSRRETS